MMTFSEDLQQLEDAYFAGMSAVDAQRIHDADRTISSIFSYENAIQAGHFAPDFELASVGGARINLRNACRRGPVVVSFHRGGWCPFCSFEVAALAQVHEAIAERGATLLAISPQSEDKAATMQREHKLGFPLLTDPGASVCEQYGLLYEMPEPIRGMCEVGGFEPITRDDTQEWLVPVPATYVIDTNQRVRYSFLDSNYRHRLDPNLLGEIVTRLQPEHTHS